MLEAILFLAAMGGVYAILYFLNHRTPVPKGCENLSVECDGCGITSCAKHPNHQESKGEKI